MDEIYHCDTLKVVKLHSTTKYFTLFLYKYIVKNNKEKITPCYYNQVVTL